MVAHTTVYTEMPLKTRRNFLLSKNFRRKKVEKIFFFKNQKYSPLTKTYSNFFLMGTNRDIVEVFFVHTSMIYYGLHTNPSFGAAPPTSNGPISDLRRS